MEITVSTRHTEVSDALRGVVLDKIGKLSRYLDGIERADVHFCEEQNRRVRNRETCEVSMEGRGLRVLAKVSAPDQFSAVDLIVAKLERQLTSLKRKRVGKVHGRLANGRAEVRAEYAG
jgi:ribosomal subunit interface protein